MAKINKVLYNIDQRTDTTAAEKETARMNIGAAASGDLANKSEIRVFKGGASTVHTDSMEIYANGGKGATAPINFNNENSNVTMVKKPADGDNGKVLMAKEQTGFSNWYEWTDVDTVLGASVDNSGKVLTVNDNGHATWQTPDGSSAFDMYLARSLSTPISTYTKDISMIDESGTHKDFFGMLGFTTNYSDTFAVIPCDSDGRLIYGNQSVNITAPATGVVTFIPFMFHANNSGEIRNIGLKGGTPGSTAAITHLQVIQRR